MTTTLDSTTTVLVVPGSDDLDAEGGTIVARANAITVTSAEEYETAGEFLAGVKRLQSTIADRFDDARHKAYEAHKAIVSTIADLLSFPKRAASIVENKMLAWRAEEDRKLREREQAARDVAERERAAELKRLQKAGAKADAKELAAAPLAVAPVIATPTPKVPGLAVTTRWRFRIVDESKIPREYMTPNEAAIGHAVRGLKDKTRIPGVEVYPEESIGGRR